MSRQLVLDTETTGLEAAKGHRIIEIGIVELLERRRSGNDFHVYLNPERQIDQGALEVHGITEAFLADKPRFADVAGRLSDYLAGAELIIHNASFDLGFLDAEYARIDPGLAPLAQRLPVIDTLLAARERFPGQRNTLDALCKRFEVDASKRELHGALLDASLLAEVYLAMTAGQVSLDLALDVGERTADSTAGSAAQLPLGPLPRILAGAADLAAHEARLAAIEKSAKAPPVWRRYDSTAATTD